MRKSPEHKIVLMRLREFKEFANKPEFEWFSELCFCILTANAKFKTASEVQAALGTEGCRSCSLKELVSCIRHHKHRFHNMKAKYIVEARRHEGLKKTITYIAAEQGTSAAREWLVHNVKGIGMKEASHFLRNVGYTDISILDRHILNLMKEHSIIRKVPKPLSKKVYLEIEREFFRLAKSLSINPAELDLILWFMKAGVVGK